MLAPLPGVDVEMAVARARAQIARSALSTPPGDNALATVAELWQQDHDDPRVRAVAGELADALRARIAAGIRKGEDAKVRDLLARHADLVRATDASIPQKAGLQDDIEKALRMRLDEAVKRNDRKRAQKVVALAGDAGVARAELARWNRQVAAINGAPRALASDEVADPGRGRVSSHPVTRAEFQRFVEATGRAPALCRERASVLRVLKPRSWRDPGFPQGPSDPVVCVSVQDAEAYALWLGTQAGGRFRLPSAAESSRRAADTGARAVGLWLRDCGKNCRERAVTAGSWRGRKTSEPLAASRGYDDVGFRLLRER
ncbi:MAG TPA: SUMF1/EgtB/PvdO family nonheme iron enzyme, partial [Lysobacter sp.]